MSKLIVLLPHAGVDDAERMQGWTLQADGTAAPVTLALSDMAAQSAQELVVVVPAAAIAWHVATLPVGIKLRGDVRLLPVLQHLLEEGLLTDAEQAHVAVAPGAQPGSPCVLVVCDRPWLSTWLQAFEQAGLRISQVVPEVVPEMLADAAVCTGRGHRAWVSYLHQQLPVTLPLDSHVVAQIAAQRVEALPAVYTDAAKAWGADKVQLLSDADYLTALLQTPWDLAQHHLASTPWVRMRRKWMALWQAVRHAPAWRSVRVATGALAVVAVLGLNVQAHMKSRALQATQVAMVQTVQSTFPHVRVVVDAPLQMQREVQALRSRSGAQTGQDMLPMLSALGIALQGMAQRPQAVEYTGSELVLRGWPADALQPLSTKLESQGYTAVKVSDTVRVQLRSGT
ncbi:MAG: type II secretion system protein GspL [Comamonas sp.]